MGPPDDTPYRKLRIRTNTNSSTAHLNPNSLESPFGLERHVMFGDFASSDTPGGGLGRDVPLSRPISTLGSDAMKFDFDEILQHFPSPRTNPGTGQKIGSSPGRWSGGSSGSAGSGSIFQFPPDSKGDGGDAGKHSMYAKKLKKALKGSKSAELNSNDQLDLILPSPLSALPSPSISEMVSFSSAHSDYDTKTFEAMISQKNSHSSSQSK